MHYLFMLSDTYDIPALHRYPYLRVQVHDTDSVSIYHHALDDKLNM